MKKTKIIKEMDKKFIPNHQWKKDELWYENKPLMEISWIDKRHKYCGKGCLTIGIYYFLSDVGKHILVSEHHQAIITNRILYTEALNSCNVLEIQKKDIKKITHIYRKGGDAIKKEDY